MNQNPLKQRLVGAIVLVALGIIFIPLFLSGERDDGAPLFGSGEPARPDISAIEKQVLDHAVPEPAPPAEVRTLVDEHTSKQALTPKPNPPVKPKPSTDAESEKQSAPAKAPAASTPAKAWAVQIGSFAEKNNALKLRDKVRGKGFRVFVESVTTSKGRVFRVRVGPEVERAKAEKLQTQLVKKAKLKGMVVAHP